MTMNQIAALCPMRVREDRCESGSLWVLLSKDGDRLADFHHPMLARIAKDWFNEAAESHKAKVRAASQPDEYHCDESCGDA